MARERRLYDAIVVGAGPGGATAAACMARYGLRVLLLDRAAFPRDKICGDAISGKSVDVLRRLGLLDRLNVAEQLVCGGVTFGGPGGEEVSIPFSRDPHQTEPTGYICARQVFDRILFQCAVDSGADVRERAEVTDLIFDERRVVGIEMRSGGATESVRAPIIVGADGAYSVVARELGMTQLDEQHYSASLRAYFRGVSRFHPDNNIELHFLRDAIPGYFWIFPMANDCANVGIGMLSAAVKKRGVNLKVLLQQCIEHPRFRDRFAGAEMIGSVKGWGLPLGSRPRTMAGDGWMLVGDAASLVDPFSGEGIGNAMISGELAARWALDAMTSDRFDADFLSAYQADVMSHLGNELRISHMLQRLTNARWLLSLVIRKAERSPDVADAISCMFADENERRKLFRPSFYLRLLTA